MPILKTTQEAVTRRSSRGNSVLIICQLTTLSRADWSHHLSLKLSIKLRSFNPAHLTLRTRPCLWATRTPTRSTIARSWTLRGPTF